MVEVIVQNATLHFDNGYGVSIQRSPNHYSGTTGFEVAVIHRTKIAEEHTVCYATEFNGMTGWCSGDTVAQIAHAIQQLPLITECNHKERA